MKLDAVLRSMARKATLMECQQTIGVSISSNDFDFSSSRRKKDLEGTTL